MPIRYHNSSTIPTDQWKINIDHGKLFNQYGGSFVSSRYSKKYEDRIAVKECMDSCNWSINFATLTYWMQSNLSMKATEGK